MKKIKINDDLFNVPERLNEIQFDQFVKLAIAYSMHISDDSTEEEKLNKTINILNAILNVDVRNIPVSYLDTLIKNVSLIPMDSSKDIVNTKIFKVAGIEYMIQTSIRDILLKDYTTIEAYLKVDKNVYSHCDKILACLLKPIIRKKVNYTSLFKYYLCRPFYKIEKPKYDIEIDGMHDVDIEKFSKQIRKELTGQDYLDAMCFFLLRVVGLKDNTICYLPTTQKIISKMKKQEIKKIKSY
jgi:hypothetical protein